MSQWSEKIPKENLSKTVNSTRYLFTSFSEVWIQINNFRKSSKKFIIDLLTKNVALNLSGAIFFVGLGYSLKWWYKDQLFVVLLKQNLPALSESQKNISWDLEKTGESILNTESKILEEEYQTWTPFIDRIDLYANYICVKFKQPWQKHVPERFLGVFGEPAQANVSKQMVTIPFTREKDWWTENTSVINNYLSSDAYKQSVGGIKLLKKKKNNKASVVANANITPPTHTPNGVSVWGYPKGNKMCGQTPHTDPFGVKAKSKICMGLTKFSTYTPLNPEGVSSATQFKPIFPKKWFKLSPRNLCSDAALNQEVILPPLGSGTSEQKSPFSKFSKMWTPRAIAFRWHNSFGIPFRGDPLSTRPVARENLLQGNSRTVARVNTPAVARVTPGWGSWRSEAVEQVDKSCTNRRFSSNPPYPKGVNVTLNEDLSGVCVETLRYLNPLQIEDLYGVSSANTSTDKLSYPLQLTKKLAGWQPFPNLLVLNSYLDEIPYKLENVLQSYFPKKNSQLLFLSTSFRKSINSRIPLQGTAMNDVVIKSNFVSTLLYKASIFNPFVLQGKSFTRYLPDLLQQNIATCKEYSYDSLLQQHEDHLHEQLVTEELEAKGTDVKVAKRWKGLLYKLKNSWVSDPSSNYKSSETENNETEKILDLFPETFLVPTKQSETYLKKLHLFETKKLLQNQFASLINSFSIGLVEKSKAIPEKDKHSHTGDELASPHALQIEDLACGWGISIGSGTSEQRRGKANVVNKTVVENNKYAPDSLGVKDSNVFAASVASDNKSNLFETNDGLITNHKFSKAYIKGAPDYHHLVDVTKKVLAVAEHPRNTQKGVILPPAFQAQNVQGKNDYSKSKWNDPVLTPSGLVELAKQKKAMIPTESAAKAFLGEELRRNNEVIVSTNGANEIVNESVAEGYWGTKVDRLTQLFAYSNIANATDAEGLDPLLLLNTLGFTFNNFSPLTNPPILLSYDKLGVVSNRVINICKPTKKNNSTTVAKGRSASSDATLPKESENSISVTQSLRNSSSSKYKLLQPRKDKLLQQHKDFFEEELRSNCGNELRRNNEVIVSTNCGNEIVNDDSVTPSLLDTPRGTGSAALEGFASDLLYKLLCVAKEPQKGIFDSYRSISFYFNPKNLNWIIFQHSTNDKFNLFLKKISVTYPLGVKGESNQPITTHLTNLMFEFLKGKTGLSYVYPSNASLLGKDNCVEISFKQKETKIETPTPGYKINVVDKGINFDKNSRYMSGYVYPDIQSNSLKAILYQWLSSDSLTPKGSASLPDLSEDFAYPKGVSGWGVRAGAEGYAKCEYNVYPYGISSSLVGSKTDHTDLTSSVAYPIQVAELTPSGLRLFTNRRFVSDLSEDLASVWGVKVAPRQRFIRRASAFPKKASVAQYPTAPFVRRCATSDQFIGNNHYLVNLEIPYKKFNHYLAKFPGFSDPNQFFITLPQISCGNENLINECQEKSILGELQTQPFQDFADPFRGKHSSWQNKDGHLSGYPKGTVQRVGSATENTLTESAALELSVGRYAYPQGASVAERNDSINIIDKSEINKKFVQKTGCDSRKVAYSGIVVRRNKWTKDFQPFKDEDNRYKKELFKEHRVEANASKSSIWGTLFLGPENPLTDRQCHFFGQKQLSTLDTNSLQRDYLRQLGKEILTQSNSKGYTELSKFSSIERTKILSLSKKVNSFFFKRRKYSYLLEPKDQWHLLFQEQLCTALEDCKKYPLSTIDSFEETNIEKLNPGFGRIKVSAPLIMARFPKKLVQSPSSLRLTSFTPKEYTLELLGSPHISLTQKLRFSSPDKFSDKSDTNLRFSSNPPYPKGVNVTLNEDLSGVCVGYPKGVCTASMPGRSLIYAPLKNLSPAITRENSHYPLFTERFSEEINAVPCLNKNPLFYSATDSLTISSPRKSLVTDSVEIKVAHTPRFLESMRWKNMKSNFLGIQNMCTSQLIQQPPTLSYSNSWAVLNQWVFLIALLFWVEQTLLNNVFPALFALEQILLSAAGLRTGENNRTQILRISKTETPKFQNLAGIDGLLGELSELVLFLRGQQNLEIASPVPFGFWNKWNRKNSYGVLLTGSPGTGKTFLVRALANEAKVPVLILSASTLTASKLNNNKPSWSIRHAFKRAKQLAPCILFIDEIDALGKSRGKIVTDINEIVADTNSGASASASFLTHKLAKSTHHNFANQMFSYEQFGQNCSNFNATLLKKWEYPLQSTILQESNEINQNSLCQDKLVDLLKIAGGFSQRGSTLAPAGENGAFTPSGSEASKSLTEFKKESTNETIYSRSDKGAQQLPRLEKEMTRGKFGPLTQLLVSMDGVSSFSGVLIMGATNRPELLDPALTRPGRFEKIIRIDKPSEQNRIEILQLYSQNLGVQQHIPWSYLATRTIGLTTADLAVAMNYSSLRAIIQDSVHTLETIEYGLNCITRY